MKVALWLVQVVLALTFLVAGARKSFLYERTRSSMRVLKDLPRPLVTFIGVCELLGALGLLLPAVAGLPSWLTSLAASGLALLMVLATIANARRGESVALNVTLLALAGFVAYGRWFV